MARIAKSLDTLRAQINAQVPNRTKVSDGWIGDAAHAARKSDHNPDENGIVRALDITHDVIDDPNIPGPDILDSWKLAEILRQHKDPRIKEVISNGRIFSSVVSPWIWRPYTGANKHANHCHIGVVADPKLYDDPREWNLASVVNAEPKPPVVVPKGITEEMRKRMAKCIIAYEVKRDANNRFVVHRPPDGSFELAGINSAVHADAYAAIAALHKADKHAEVEDYALRFVLGYTKHAAGWTDDAGLEFMLRDCIYHRGPTGAAIILQKAVGVVEDGEVGPTTRQAMAKFDTPGLLQNIRDARELYEIEKYGKTGNRAVIWQGLENRWDKALAEAKKFHAEQKGGGVTVPAIIIGTGTVVGGAIATKDNKTDFDYTLIALVGMITLGAVIIVWRLTRRK